MERGVRYAIQSSRQQTSCLLRLGDVVYIKIPRLPILILSSLEDAEDLLVRRANQWSGRRYNTMVDDL